MSPSVRRATVIVLLLVINISAVAYAVAADTPVYTIRQGDTLWDISRAQGVELQALMRLNGLDENSILQIGQKLNIPASGGSERKVSSGVSSSVNAYRVQSGDNLWQIARARGLSVNDIVAVNPGLNPEKLQIGQVLRLPGSGAAAAVTAKASPARITRSAAPRYDWPLKGSITSGYGWRKSGSHHGIDIAADVGTSIKTSAPGVVSYAGWLNIYGNTVIVDHPDGSQTLYAHASKLLVGQGDIVRRSQFIAKVGTTGRTTGPHLHFEIRLGGETVNPVSYLP
ncbi:MAG: M23 family metallopeptidase [Syntrophomonadaceae bacterium]|nr:M23 family metallopeptidase [Syntrophomonadaceae bacterium]